MVWHLVVIQPGRFGLHGSVLAVLDPRMGTSIREWCGAMTTLPVGTVLCERYEIVRAIKWGGMGVVYEARDRRASAWALG